jgi:hypothetical protein
MGHTPSTMTETCAPMTSDYLPDTRLGRLNPLISCQSACWINFKPDPSVIKPRVLLPSHLRHINTDRGGGARGSVVA